MFLRMVTHIIRVEESEKNAETYARAVLTALRETQGCIFASLIQNIGNPQECISLTLWASRNESIAYEESGLYAHLVDSLRPYFLESTDWKLELSEDLSLEYLPTQTEPTVERFDESAPGPENMAKLRSNPFAVHILSLSVQEDQLKTFESIFAAAIHSKYKLRKGFLDFMVVRQHRKFFVISFWDERVDLQSVSAFYSIDGLLESIRNVLPSFVRWQVTQTRDVHRSASSEDVRSAVYRCLTAEWFVR
jgi:heme-degrading monooxygenase HmoA